MVKQHIRQFLPANYKNPKAKVLAAILDAIESSEDYLEQFLILSQNNLFENRADYAHFLKLLSAQGVTLPAGGGLNFESFRKIAPLIAHLPKQTINIASVLVETFFGLSLTHPNVVSGKPEFYSLKLGDDLIIETDNGTVSVSVDVSVFSDPTQVSAGELAAYLSGAQNLYLADAFLNKDNNLTYVRLLSKGSGQGDWIKVKGGTLQNILLFPPVIDTVNTFETQFRLVKEAPYTDVVRVEWANPDVIRFEQINISGPVFSIGLHGLNNGTIVTLTSEGTLPAPFTLNTQYYVVSATDNTFSLSLTSSGTVITATDKGTPTFDYVNRVTPTNSAQDPQLFKLQPTDVVTIRNFFDVDSSGISNVFVIDDQGNQVIDITSGNPVTVPVKYNSGNYSVLNGTWSIDQTGQDFFYIKVRGLDLQALPPSTGALVQLGPKDIVFTRPYQHRVYEQDEYVTLSETKVDTLTVTTPAVPPIVRRFLEGSMNIAGTDLGLASFSRTLVTPKTDSVQISDNSLVLFSSNQVDARFSDKPYKVITKVGSSYVIDDTDPNYEVLPYSTSTPIGVNDPFTVQLNSDLVKVVFNYRHGFKPGDAITINGALPNAGYSVNGEWIVEEVPSETSLIFKNHFGPYAGRVVPFGLQSVTIGNVTGRTDEAEVQITFPSSSVLASLNIEVGKPLLINVTGNEVITASSAWSVLVSTPMLVTEVIGSYVYARSNASYPLASVIANNVKLRVPKTNFGGNFGRQFFNAIQAFVQIQLLDGYNYNRTILGFSMQVLGFPTGAVTNTAWQGPFLYDPNGESGIRYQVGQPYGILTGSVSKGSNKTTINLTTTSAFPPTGYVALSFGDTAIEGPIRYISITSGSSLTTIELDPSYTFKTSHPIGAQVRQVVSLSPHQPRDDGEDFAGFITSASPARNTLFNYLKQVLSVSIFLEEDVRLPKIVWEDPGIPIYN